MQPLPTDPAQRKHVLKTLLKLRRMSPQDRKDQLQRMREVKADNARAPSQQSSRLGTPLSSSPTISR